MIKRLLAELQVPRTQKVAALVLVGLASTGLVLRLRRAPSPPVVVARESAAPRIPLSEELQVLDGGGGGERTTPVAESVVETKAPPPLYSPDTLTGFVEYLRARRLTCTGPEYYPDLDPATGAPRASRLGARPSLSYQDTLDRDRADPAFVDAAKHDFFDQDAIGIRPGDKIQGWSSANNGPIVPDLPAPAPPVELPDSGARLVAENLGGYQPIAKIVNLAGTFTVLEAVRFEVHHSRRSENVPYYIFAFDRAPGQIQRLTTLSELFRAPIPPWTWQQAVQGRYVLLHPNIDDRQTNVVKTAFLEYCRP